LDRERERDFEFSFVRCFHIIVIISRRENNSSNNNNNNNNNNSREREKEICGLGACFCRFLPRKTSSSIKEEEVET